MPRRTFDRNQDYFHRKVANSWTPARKKKSSPALGICLALLLLAIAATVCYVLFRKPANLDSVPVTTGAYVKGDSVTLKGTLQPYMDVSIASHVLTVETADALEQFYVKSTTANLDLYTGEVVIMGTIENIYHSIPIILVESISGEMSEEATEATGLIEEEIIDTTPDTYFPEAGIQILPSFFDHFILMNEGEGGQIRFSSLQDEEGKEYVINYFRCTAGVADKDCKTLQTTFSQNSSRSITTSNGITYYKSSLTNSRFANNNNRWGILINDVPEDVITLLKDHIVLVNKKSLQNWATTASARRCREGNTKLQTLTKTNYTLKKEGLVADFEGEGGDYKIACSVLVDLSLVGAGKLLDFTILSFNATGSGANTGTAISTTQSSSTENKVVSPVTRNPNVAQFPLNIEKALIYTSSRGYTATLPSPNLAYAASIIDAENFGQSGLKCTNVIRVVKYADKEQLQTNPAVEIYECSAKNAVTSPGEQYLVVESVGKTFIIKINDPAWIDFAKNISFNAKEA